MNIYSEISKTIGETPLVRLKTMNVGLNVIWGWATLTNYNNSDDSF